MRKNLIFGGFIMVGLYGVVGCSLTAQHQDSARRSSPATNRVHPMSVSASYYNSKEWQTRKRLFDKNKASAAAIFAAATKVESFRLFSNAQERLMGRTKNFSYFAKGAVQGKPFATRLAAVVLDAKTYSWPGQSTKQCYFEPGVAFRIWKNAEFVDTIICFHCNQLAVLENNPQIPQRSIGGSLRGRFYVAGDFDSARSSLVALSKEAFPEDTQIQALR